MKSGIRISTEAIEKILQLNHLPRLASLREITTGLTNPVFVINEQCVLRVDTNTSEQDADRFTKEAFLYTTLARHSVPVPQLFSFDNSREIINQDFLLLSYIAGETLASSFKRQSHTVQKSLSFQLGELAYQIRSIDLDEFMKGEKLLRKKMNWQQTVMAEHTAYFSLVQEKGYLSPKELSEIASIFQQFKALKMPTEQERLVHGDFSMDNIQVKDDRIVGIFDFEFATLGDPLYDLQKLPVHFGLGEGFDISLFWQGYNHGNFSVEENIRFKMYCLNQGLWTIWATITQRFPFGEAEIARGKNLIHVTLPFNI